MESRRMGRTLPIIAAVAIGAAAMVGFGLARRGASETTTVVATVDTGNTDTTPERSAPQSEDPATSSSLDAAATTTSAAVGDSIAPTTLAAPPTVAATAAPTTAPPQPTLPPTPPPTIAPVAPPVQPSGLLALPVPTQNFVCVADPSTDNAQRKTTFGVENLVDGRTDTAWRCPGNAGAVGGEYPEPMRFTFTFAAPTTIDNVGMTPGYAKRDPVDGTDRFFENRRVWVSTWTCFLNGERGPTYRQQFDPDNRETQWMDGALGMCDHVELELNSVGNPGSPRIATALRDFTAVSEVSMMGHWD